MSRRPIRTGMRTHFVVLAVASLPFSIGPVATQPQLARQEIQTAIDFGATHEVTPYLLKHAWGSTTDNVVVGAVYTPFLRVALASHAAAAAGRHLDIDHVPPELTEARLDLAIRWYVHVPCRSSSKPGVVAARRGSTGPAGKLDGTPPSSTRPTSWLNSFGGQLPYDDVVFVASYPMEFLRDDIDFFVVLEGVGENGLPCQSIEIGRIPSADLKNWR